MRKEGIQASRLQHPEPKGLDQAAGGNSQEWAFFFCNPRYSHHALTCEIFIAAVCCSFPGLFNTQGFLVFV